MSENELFNKKIRIQFPPYVKFPEPCGLKKKLPLELLLYGSALKMSSDTSKAYGILNNVQHIISGKLSTYTQN